MTIGLVADIDADAPVRGHLFDVSRGGAYVVLDTTQPIGTRVSLSLNIGEEEEAPALAMGRVARFVSLGHRTGMGISFYDMDRQCRRFLRDLEQQSDAQRLASFQLIRNLRLTVR